MQFIEFSAILLVAYTASAAVLIGLVVRAPMGHEDRDGFHVDLPGSHHHHHHRH